MDIKISPIFYMGCKKKLINKGLIDLFPKDINMFVDLFAGSGIISMNVEAKRYIVNDFNENVCKLIKMFKENDAKFIIKTIEEYIQKYQLEYGKTDKISFDNRSKYYDKELAEIHKKNYKNLVNDYNKNSNEIMLYTILIYCFCHQIRTNSKNEFNMPCGNGIFTKDNREWIKMGCSHFKNVTITNNDFRKLKVDKLSSQDFVYLDPPYFNTTATYNENGGWTEQDENDLYKLCEELTQNEIKFAMSNVFECKGIKNDKLIKWVEDNNFNVYTFDKFTYSACGKGNSNAKEVLIANY